MPKSTKHHDDLLRAKADMTMDTAVRRILKRWDRATPNIVAEGAVWYPNTFATALDLAHQGDITVEHAVAVISHLSPQTRWAQNVAGAYAVVLKGKVSGLLGRNVEGARRALEAVDGPAAVATLNGPKTKRFAANILGDHEVVTVDVWAAKVVGIDDDKTLYRVGVYDAIERAFQIAARRRGVDPAVMQATTWIEIRNGRAG